MDVPATASVPGPPANRSASASAPIRASTTPERGRHDIARDVVEDLRGAHVVVEQLQHFPVHEREELGLRHDPAAQDDALGRDRADQVHEAEGEVVGLERPGRMVGGQGLRILSPARPQGGAAGQTLQTVVVERARTLEGIRAPVTGKAQVADLGMDQAVQSRPPMSPPPPIPVPTVR